MRRIVVTEFVSLDGVMEEPRWTFDFSRGAEGDKFKHDELFAAGALLLGRVTYQGFAQAWPHMDEGDFGMRMNTIPKYVVSSTLTGEEATWGETTVISGDAMTELARIRQEETGGDLLVHGSAQLASDLISHRLVDELRLLVFPILLGEGKRLFPAALSESARLVLTSSATAGDGILMLTYQPAPAGDETAADGQQAVGAESAGGA
ncbi:MAG TPA: dihydrofolate reductase family protein [Streptosporangiaceae bacterium]|jgi:dihydrofolate reductase